MKATRTDTMKNEIKYEKSELELMTTYQLREICRREKIMNGVIHPLDKEELIQTIMRYMGKRQDFLICDRKKGGEERVEEFLKNTRIVIKPSEELYCQSQILAYEGLSIEYYDDYTIPYKKRVGRNKCLFNRKRYDTLCDFKSQRAWGKTGKIVSYQGGGARDTGDAEKRLQDFLHGTSDIGELVSFVLW